MGGIAQDNSQISPHTQQIIDAEVQRIVTEQYERARSLLRDRRDALESLAAQLLEHETLDGTAVADALAKPKAGPKTKTVAATGAATGTRAKAAAKNETDA
jgi:cell division protease FtsH